MAGQEKIARGYTVAVRQAADHYHVLYAPRGLQHARGKGGAPAQVPARFEVVAQIDGEDVHLRWENPPQDRDATQEDFEQDARGRVRLLRDWLARLAPLVRTVETWAQELGWATRRIDKRLEDSEIGTYRVPALLMQEGTERVLLDPLGRSSPGTEGVVDLYLMPAYDDIATLYFYDGRWNLHYGSSGAAVAAVREAPAKPLSKGTLQEVLEALRQNAA
jgi:hypothetical protein